MGRDAIRFYEILRHVPAIGQRRGHVILRCPWCKAEVKAYRASLSGRGKRCTCGALHRSTMSSISKGKLDALEAREGEAAEAGGGEG